MADKKHPFSGFGRLNRRHERLRWLLQIEAITPAHAEILRQNEISKEWGGDAIENFVGYFPVPVGIVCLNINGTDCYIPYATEETSVVAAACKAGSIFRSHCATIETEVVGSHLSEGQILIIVPPGDVEVFKDWIEDNKDNLIERANEAKAQDMVERKGGVKGVCCKRVLEKMDGDNSGVVIHVIVDTVDSMGANKVVSICEYLGKIISEGTGYEYILGILTNYVEKIVKARVVLDGFDPEKGRRIQISSEFAKRDIHRAVTNNKGMLNALLAIAQATANDTRALAVLFGSYAVHSGRLSLSQWYMEGGSLVGEFAGPIDIGIIGGAMVHPIATVCMEIMGVKRAMDLRQVMAAAALAQNFAALLALTDKDKPFSIGHMGLHAPNLARQAGARVEEIDQVVEILRQVLARKESLSFEDARIALEEVRGKKGR